MEAPDERLMREYYACDRDAFDRLTVRYYGMLVAWFRPLVGRDADDLAVETLLLAARTKRTQRGLFAEDRGSLRTWLFTIARHTRHDFLDRSSRQVPIQTPLADDDAGDVSDTIASGDPTPEEAACVTAVRELVHQALTKLGERDREVLLLRLGPDLNGHELATVLELTVVAANTRLSRARARLRDELALLGLREAPRDEALDDGWMVLLEWSDSKLILRSGGQR